jgi:hypothetical protein
MNILSQRSHCSKFLCVSAPIVKWHIKISHHHYEQILVKIFYIWIAFWNPFGSIVVSLGFTLHDEKTFPWLLVKIATLSNWSYLYPLSTQNTFQSVLSHFRNFWLSCLNVSIKQTWETIRRRLLDAEVWEFWNHKNLGSFHNISYLRKFQKLLSWSAYNERIVGDACVVIHH